MADYTLEDVMKALRAADAAGNVEDARRLARIADGMRKQNNGFMPQLNRGIAESVGGLVDFINPFDEQTGSAVSGLTNLMERGGINVAQAEPEGLLEGFARGTGAAAGAMLPAAGAAGALSRAAGPVGGAAGEVFRGMATRGGMAAETLAGGLSGAAMEGAEQAGAGQTGQMVAGLLAPMAIPAAAAMSPARIASRKLGPQIAAEIAPFTRRGAQEVAGQRMQSLAGGEEGAEAARAAIASDNPLNLTPAQQTGDPRLLAVEQLAARQDPELARRLEQRAEASRESAEGQLAQQGNIEDTRQFFEQRRREFKSSLQSRVDDILRQGNEAVSGIAPVRSEMENSQQVFNRLSTSLDEAKMVERELWAAVPMQTTVGTTQSRQALQNWRDKFGPVGERNIPADARRWLEEDGLPEFASVRDLHQLYSSMRQAAREARSGVAPNERAAAAADGIAEAILDDLGATSSTGEAGRAINEARAFSRAMHETFDQGAAGKLLQQTRTTEQRIDPELGLRATVGRGEAPGAVASRQIEEAAAFPSQNAQAIPQIEDYLKDRFRRAAVAGDGTFNARAARQFMSDNTDLMSRYPELRGAIDEAVSAKESADAFASRVSNRVARLENARIAAGERLLNGRPEQAIKAFTDAQNPVRAARLVVNEARKDETGRALSGLKSVLSSELIGTGATGKGVEEALSNPRLMAALRQVFTPAEINRMRIIGRELSKLEAAQRGTPDIGESLSGSSANEALLTLARIKAAQVGGQIGAGSSGFGSLQTAGILSGRVSNIMQRLATDKAAQLMADAVEDPELFRLLLSSPASPRVQEKGASLLLPYAVGSSAATLEAQE